ncbi:MAG: gliding motility-associated C-terminal domain-containing protein, partial [Sphingobacteriales bacterium]
INILIFYPFYHYKNPGNHKVTLTIFNQNGCSDTFSTFIYTPDTIPPVRPEIYYVTVTPNNTIQIVYNTANNSDFAKYHVKQLAVGPATEIFTSSKITDTIAVSTNSNVFAQSYCFTTQVEDDCGLISQPSLAHCSIHLDVIPNSSIANRLDWTGYQGWAAVSAYEIYRKIDQGSFSLLATASESARSYIDSNLCDKMYTYYIKALHPNGRFVSTSNLDSLKPDYIYQNVPLDMYKTTVVADAFTYTAWRPSEQVNVRMYVIDKYTENIGWQPAYRTTTNNYITDNNVNVQTTSYKYQVRVIDNCGNISPLSNPATSIVLNSTVTNDKRYLSWNKYYLWNAGVKEYLVQLQDNNKNFQTIAKVPQTDSQYVDDSAHTDVDEATCYRIVALENAAGRDQDTSISNMRCAILPARIFIPNAFTPNADGHNEVFKLEALSIHKLTQSKDLQFTFRIFNRWGELLFETHDVNAGWDGRFNGEPSPLGVYAYTVEAHGLEGSRLFLNGTFTLLK